MKNRILASTLLLTYFVFAGPALSENCISDNDCKKKQLCHEGRCVKLEKNESLLDITLETPVTGAAVSIDNVPMGSVPWQGIISAGEHTVKVEAPGYQAVELPGKARPGKREPISIRLEPEPAPSQGLPPPPQSDYPPLPPETTFPGEEEQGEAEADDESEKSPGMLALGVFGSGGYGTFMWGSTKRPAGSIFGGGLFAVRFIEKPVWFELGLTGSYGARFVKSWPDYGDQTIVELHLGLLPRLLFPVLEKFLYLGAEVEAGMAIANNYFLSVAVRADLALMINEFIEIRINPIGLEFLQEFKSKGAIVGYTGNVGVAFRFL